MAGLIGAIESNAASIGKSLRLVAPILGTVLGSPLAGIGITMLANIFGANPKDIPDLISKINGDPDAAVKIRQLEFDHIEELAKISSSDFSVETADKQDARKYAGMFKDFLRHMAYLVTFGFFAALFLVFLPLAISPEEKNLLSMLVGMLASKWQTIIDYFFGSSRHLQGENFNG